VAVSPARLRQLRINFFSPWSRVLPITPDSALPAKIQCPVYTRHLSGVHDRWLTGLGRPLPPSAVGGLLPTLSGHSAGRDGWRESAVNLTFEAGLWDRHRDLRGRRRVGTDHRPYRRCRSDREDPHPPGVDSGGAPRSGKYSREGAESTNPPLRNRPAPGVARPFSSRKIARSRPSRHLIEEARGHRVGPRQAIDE